MEETALYTSDINRNRQIPANHVRIQAMYMYASDQETVTIIKGITTTT